MEKILVCTYDENLLPKKPSLGAVCRDLKISDKLEILPSKLGLIGIGIKTFIPLGRHSKVYARGGLPIKKSLMLANSVGVIDSDYRGEYMMQLYNFGEKIVVLEKYTRVTQMEFLPNYYEDGKFGAKKVPKIEFIVDKTLYDNFEKEYNSFRSDGRFHSTGS